MAAIYGVDVSKHQGGSMDFAAMAKNNPPMHFAVCRASYGGDGVDSRFALNWSRLTTDPAPMVRGAYHFAYQNLNRGRAGGEREARNFVAQLKAVGNFGDGCLPPWLDFEKYNNSEPGYSTADAIRDNLEFVRGFFDVADNELGRACGIYTGANVWRYQADDTAEFSDRALWQVAYTPQGANVGTAPPTIADGAWPWDLWQWSGGGDWDFFRKEFGVLDGGPVSGIIDVNRVQGGLPTLERLSRVSSSGGLGLLLAGAAAVGAAAFFARKRA